MRLVLRAAVSSDSLTLACGSAQSNNEMHVTVAQYDKRYSNGDDEETPRRDLVPQEAQTQRSFAQQVKFTAIWTLNRLYSHHPVPWQVDDNRQKKNGTN